MLRHFNIEELQPFFGKLSKSINSQQLKGIDLGIKARLKASPKVTRHGTDGRILQFHIWDRYQPGVFQKKYFKYEVQHDPVCRYTGTSTTNFCVQFWVSKIRIYHERETVIARFWRDLQKIQLKGFALDQNDQAIFLMNKFRVDRVGELEAKLGAKLTAVINEVHPIFYRVLDAFNVPLSKDQRREIIEGRGKKNPVDRLNPAYGKAPQFNRNVPRALRLLVFKRDASTCQHCGISGTSTTLHADHVLPVSLGGLTLLSNLQTLCGPCNLRKGGRVEQHAS